MKAIYEFTMTGSITGIIRPIKTVNLAGDAGEVLVVPGFHSADLRVGYRTYNTITDHPKYRTIRRLTKKIATEEIVCVAEPTGVPNEYLLTVAGRRGKILLKLDHALEIDESPSRPEVAKVLRKTSPKIHR